MSRFESTRMHNVVKRRLRFEPLESRQVLAEITGTIWDDSNLDGQKGSDERELASWPVFLDYNQNNAPDSSASQFDASDLTFRETSITNANAVDQAIDEMRSETHVINTAQVKRLDALAESELETEDWFDWFSGRGSEAKTDFEDSVSK